MGSSDTMPVMVQPGYAAFERIQQLLEELGRLRQECRKGDKKTRTPSENYRFDQKLALISDKEAELEAAKAEFERKTGRSW